VTILALSCNILGYFVFYLFPLFFQTLLIFFYFENDVILEEKLNENTFLMPIHVFKKSFDIRGSSVKINIKLFNQKLTTGLVYYLISTLYIICCFSL